MHAPAPPHANHAPTTTGLSRDLWGHMAIKKVLSQQQMPAHLQAAQTVLQCSSLGTINQKWLEELQDSLNAGKFTGPQPAAAAAAAASGSNGGAGGGVNRAGSSQQPQQQRSPGWPQQLQQQRQRRRPRVHFVWPTAEDVRGCIEGWTAGGSIPTQSKKITADCLQCLFRR